MKILFVFLVLAGFSPFLATAEVSVPSAIDHSSYDRLLKKYVDERGLVAYQAWKNNSEDYMTLKNYLAQFAPRGTPAEGNEKIASLINGYNAFVLEWILQKYPTESIQSFKDSFSGKRYLVGGQTVSLDDIEMGTLRPEYSYRTHSVLVCAARSCPPLQRSAYSGASLEQQDDQAYQVWLGRNDLNEFKPNENKVEISNIFRWFKSDFDKAGGVPKILVRYGPEQYRKFLSGTGYQIEIKAYNWGLNDQGEHGHHYTSGNLYFDKFF